MMKLRYEILFRYIFDTRFNFTRQQSMLFLLRTINPLKLLLRGLQTLRLYAHLARRSIVPIGFDGVSATICNKVVCISMRCRMNRPWLLLAFERFRSGIVTRMHRRMAGPGDLRLRIKSGESDLLFAPRKTRLSIRSNLRAQYINFKLISQLRYLVSRREPPGSMTSSTKNSQLQGQDILTTASSRALALQPPTRHIPINPTIVAPPPPRHRYHLLTPPPNLSLSPPPPPPPPLSFPPPSPPPTAPSAHSSPRPRASTPPLRLSPRSKPRLPATAAYSSRPESPGSSRTRDRTRASRSRWGEKRAGWRGTGEGGMDLSGGRRGRGLRGAMGRRNCWLIFRRGLWVWHEASLDIQEYFLYLFLPSSPHPFFPFV